MSEANVTHDSGQAGDHGAHASHPVVPYALIFFALMILTIVTVAASRQDMGKALNIIVALAIATVKASMVMMFFMHLKYEQRIMVVVALLPFVLAAILTAALFPDVVFGQYPIPHP